MRLLGRAAELDCLSQALEATRDGGSELVLIEGELGIGKTTLLEAAARDLEGVGLGWARCSELVSGIPYAALALALREVLGTSTVDVRDFPALAGVFPEMRVRSTRAAPRTVDALEALSRSSRRSRRSCSSSTICTGPTPTRSWRSTTSAAAARCAA